MSKRWLLVLLFLLLTLGLALYHWIQQPENAEKFPISLPTPQTRATPPSQSQSSSDEEELVSPADKLAELTQAFHTSLERLLAHTQNYNEAYHDTETLLSLHQRLETNHSPTAQAEWLQDSTRRLHTLAQRCAALVPADKKSGNALSDERNILIYIHKESKRWQQRQADQQTHALKNLRTPSPQLDADFKASLQQSQATQRQAWERLIQWQTQILQEVETYQQQDRTILDTFAIAALVLQAAADATQMQCVGRFDTKTEQVLKGLQTVLSELSRIGNRLFQLGKQSPCERQMPSAVQ